MKLKPCAGSLIVAALVIWYASGTEAACTGTSPTWTTTPDQASVSACIAKASTGDTINVTEGNATWTASVNWSGKSLNLNGAGSGRTVLTAATTNMSFFIYTLPSTATTNMNPSRITGFTFACGGIQIVGRGWRIDHNTFTCPSVKTLSVHVVGETDTTASTGLVDHNTFINARVLVTEKAAISQKELEGTTQWSTPLALGSDDATYIEDNTFLLTVFGNAVDCNYSGRFVLRFNTMTDTYPETHSSQGYNRACRKWEIYHNKVQRVTQTVYYQTFIRGGTGMMFQNTMSGTFGAGNFISIDNVRSFTNFDSVGKCDGASDWDTKLLSNGWPCRDQIGTGTDDAPWVSGSYPPRQSTKLAPAYFFLNTTNGTNTAVKVVNDSGTYIVANRDFYTYIQPFTGASGVGAGTLADRPTTCTPGVGYWATDQGEWNARNPGADGQLYKCTGPNTWTLSYTPYTYPHPLQGTDAVAPPAGPGTSLLVR